LATNPRFTDSPEPTTESRFKDSPEPTTESRFKDSPEPSTESKIQQESVPDLGVNNAINIDRPVTNDNNINNNPTPTPDQSQTPNLVRAQRRIEAPTARLQPGMRFLDYIPSAPITEEAIINCLKVFIEKNPSLDTDIIIRFEDKLDHLKCQNPANALSLALCWLYTADSWVYQKTNLYLREDSRVMEQLSPFINGLMQSFRYLDPIVYYCGTVYRRCKLNERGLEFYKKGIMFIWSAFTSTTVEFSPEANFGDILFIIRVPEDKKQYAIKLEEVSDFPLEKEVLLLPNIGYRVLNVDRETTYWNVKVAIELSVAYICV